MHIGVNTLILRPGEYSGVHVAVRGSVQALVQAAAPADRFTFYTQRTPPAGLPPEGGAVQHHRPLWPVGWRAGRITYEQFCLHSRVFKDDVDLLYCPAYVMPHWCLKPVVLAVHDLFALRQPALCTNANRSHFARTLPKSLARAKRIVVPSAWVQEEIQAYAAGEESLDAASLAARTRVLPWGVDARFQPVTDARRLEEVAIRYGLPPKFVLYVGRVEPKKNVQRAIEAYFAAIMSRSLPHRLVLVGPKGWGVEKKVQRMIRSLGLENKIVQTGFVPDDDLPVIYSLASCLLFPSVAEGFGLPVLEAMACGAPVVGADIPPLRALAGEGALLAAPDDLPGLRLALETVLTDEAKVQALVERGQRRAQTFSWSDHGRALLALMQEVILEDQAARQ